MKRAFVLTVFAGISGGLGFASASSAYTPKFTDYISCIREVQARALLTPMSEAAARARMMPDGVLLVSAPSSAKVPGVFFVEDTGASFLEDSGVFALRVEDQSIRLTIARRQARPAEGKTVERALRAAVGELLEGLSDEYELRRASLSPEEDLALRREFHSALSSCALIKPLRGLVNRERAQIPPPISTAPVKKDGAVLTGSELDRGE